MVFKKAWQIQTQRAINHLFIYAAIHLSLKLRPSAYRSVTEIVFTQEMQPVDRELHLELPESPINPAFIHMSIYMSSPIPNGCDPSFYLKINGETLWKGCQSFRLHGLSRFAYTYKSKCFVKMDEHHCLQLPTVTRVLGARASAFGAKTLQWTMITKPLKSPRYKSDILQPSQKCSKMYGTGPRYNEILTYKEPR